MRNITLNQVKNLPAIDQLKILKALCTTIRNTPGFSFKKDGICINKDNQGEYSVSTTKELDFIADDKTVKSAFSSLQLKIPKELGCKPGEMPIDVIHVCFISFSKSKTIINSCTKLINDLELMNAKKQSIRDEIQPEKNEAIENFDTKQSKAEDFYQKILESSQNHLFLDPMNMGKIQQKTKQFGLSLKNLKTEKKGNFSHVVTEQDVKINRKNGLITSISHNNIKRKYDTNGSMTEEKEVAPKYALKLLLRGKGQELNTAQIINELNKFQYFNGGKIGNIKISDNRQFFHAAAMSLAEGEELGKFLEKNKDFLNENKDELAKLTLAIMDQLEKIHQDGKVHADIKVENIIISRKEDGCYKVTIVDFGISAEHGAPHQQSGSPYFMAPEIFDEHPTYHHNQDYYALFASILRKCSLNGIDNCFLASNDKKLFESLCEGEHSLIPVNYIAKFSSLNQVPSTPISAFLCEQPSKLPLNHVVRVREQLNGIANPRKDKEKATQPAPQITNSLEALHDSSQDIKQEVMISPRAFGLFGSSSLSREQMQNASLGADVSLKK